MQELRDLLRGSTDFIPLDVAALQIATIEDPQLEIEPYLVLLDSYATEFSERVAPDTPGDEFVSLLNEYLFEELGFRGNAGSYYEAANSCLDQVLTRRLGIPITLSLVYMEIGRRLGRTINGIGLPGHFLVQIDEADFHALIDPFHGGQVLTEAESFDLAREATGMTLDDDPALLQPVSARHIATRMLNNLRAIYFRLQQPEKAVRVLDLLIEAAPDGAEEYKQRGICLAQIGRFGEAREDLRRYLRLTPAAADRPEVMAELDRISRIISLQD